MEPMKLRLSNLFQDRCILPLLLPHASASLSLLSLSLSVRFPQSYLEHRNTSTIRSDIRSHLCTRCFHPTKNLRKPCTTMTETFRSKPNNFKGARTQNSPKPMLFTRTVDTHGGQDSIFNLKEMFKTCTRKFSERWSLIPTPFFSENDKTTLLRKCPIFLLRPTSHRKS